MTNIFISGLTAAGKTTHSKLICEEHNLTYISASVILLQKLSIDPSNTSRNLWVNTEGDKIAEKRITDKSIDDWVDEKLTQLAETHHNCVFDTFGLPWLTNQLGLRIWLASDINSRIWKAMISHGEELIHSYEELAEKIDQKDRYTREHLLMTHSFDIYKDYDIFDFAIDLSSFISGPTQIASRKSIADVQVIISAITNLYFLDSTLNKERFKDLFKKYGKSVFIKHPLKI